MINAVPAVVTVLVQLRFHSSGGLRGTEWESTGLVIVISLWAKNFRSFGAQETLTAGHRMVGGVPAQTNVHWRALSLRPIIRALQRPSLQVGHKSEVAGGRLRRWRVAGSSRGQVLVP